MIAVLHDLIITVDGWLVIFEILPLYLCCSHLIYIMCFFGVLLKVALLTEQLHRGEKHPVFHGFSIMVSSIFLHEYHFMESNITPLQKEPQKV